MKTTCFCGAVINPTKTLPYEYRPYGRRLQYPDTSAALDLRQLLWLDSLVTNVLCKGYIFGDEIQFVGTSVNDYMYERIHCVNYYEY